MSAIGWAGTLRKPAIILPPPYSYPANVFPGTGTSQIATASTLSPASKNNAVFCESSFVGLASNTAMWRTKYFKNHVCAPGSGGIRFGVSYEQASANGWLLHNSGGTELTWNTDWRLADLSNPAYQDAWAQNVYNDITSAGLNAVYNDGNTDDYHDDTGAQDAYTPGNVLIPKATWKSDYVIPFWNYVGEYLRTRGVKICANSAVPSDNDATFTRAWWNSLVFNGSYNNGQGVFDWFFAENWMRVDEAFGLGTDSLRLDSTSAWHYNWDGWRQVMDTAHGINSGFGGFHWGFLSDQSHDDADGTYTFGTLLLFFDPSLYDFHILETRDSRDQATLGSHNVNIGFPTDDAIKQANGTWTRSFSNGRVIVNPTTSPQTTAVGTLASGRAYIGV